MRDAPWRRAIKAVARWRYGVDLAATRRLRRWFGHDQPLTLQGACTACGACCETPAVQVWPPLLYFRRVRALILAWHRHINGFELIGQDRRHGVLIFRCTHYDPATKLCDSYDSRPGLCRDYPRNLLDDPRPEFLPPCTLYPLHRDHERRRAELGLAELPPDKRDKVAREFFVWQPPADAPSAAASPSPPSLVADGQERSE